MKKRNAFVLFFLIFALYGCENLVDVQTPLNNRYNSSRVLFSISYPSDWSVKETTMRAGSPNVEFLSPSLDLMQHKIVVGVVEANKDKGMTLSKYSLDVKNITASQNKILNEGGTTINGHDAYFLDFKKIVRGSLVEEKLIVTIIGIKEYGIYYACYEPYFQKLLPLGERIIDTFALN